MQTIKGSSTAAPGKQANKNKSPSTGGNGETRANTSGDTISGNSASSIPTREEIARLAYKLYLQSGSQEGRDLENWTQAEQLLRQRGGHQHQVKTGGSHGNGGGRSREQF
jgi:hypothetical protein